MTQNALTNLAVIIAIGFIIVIVAAWLDPEIKR